VSQNEADSCVIPRMDGLGLFYWHCQMHVAGNLTRATCEIIACSQVRVLPLERRFEFDTARSLPGDFRRSEKCRHFRRLSPKSLFSGAQCRTPRTEGREFRSESLLDEISISEILGAEEQRPVAFSRRRFEFVLAFAAGARFRAF
jgi:hypothetical protein